MKYKKHIVTGALALSLLVGGSSVFAATPQDLGIKNVQSTAKIKKTIKGAKHIKRHQTVGTISTITGDGFILEVKNKKTNVASSIDVKTDSMTLYSENGKDATSEMLVTGKKVIVSGAFDKATNTITAKRVKMVTMSSHVKN